MSVQAVMGEQLATVLAARWEQTSRKLAEMAAAIPAEDFEKAPVAGLRTCGAILRHVAFWNRYVADSLGGREVNESANELPLSEYPDKRSILDEVTRTSEEAASALRRQSGKLSSQAAELVITFIEHTSEHYGQMAVYGRLLGIVPPASRG